MALSGALSTRERPGWNSPCRVYAERADILLSVGRLTDHGIMSVDNTFVDLQWAVGLWKECHRLVLQENDKASQMIMLVRRT